MRKLVENIMLLTSASLADAITTNMLHPNPAVGEASPIIAAAMNIFPSSHHTLVILALGILVPLPVYGLLVRANEHIFAEYFLTANILAQTLAAAANIMAIHGFINNIPLLIIYLTAITMFYIGQKKQQKKNRRKDRLENLPQHDF